MWKQRWDRIQQLSLCLVAVSTIGSGGGIPKNDTAFQTIFGCWEIRDDQISNVPYSASCAFFIPRSEHVLSVPRPSRCRGISRGGAEDAIHPMVEMHENKEGKKGGREGSGSVAALLELAWNRRDFGP